MHVSQFGHKEKQQQENIERSINKEKGITVGEFIKKLMSTI